MVIHRKAIKKYRNIKKHIAYIYVITYNDEYNSKGGRL